MSSPVNNMGLVDTNPPPEYVPEWRRVTFPTGKMFTYPTLEKANNARILSRAWDNWRAKEALRNVGLDSRKLGWSAFARHLGIAKPTGPVRNKEGKVRQRGLGDNAGKPFFQHCNRGTLPKDPTVRQKLYDLAGYPWK